MKMASLLTSLCITAGFSLLLTGCNPDAPQQTTTTRTATRTTHVGSNIPQPDSGSNYTGSPNSITGTNTNSAAGITASHGGMR